MSRLSILTLLLLLFASVVDSSAQNDKPDCPTISVTGPAGIPDRGERVPFTARIDKAEPSSNLKYHWTVSIGEVVSGQGTSSIEVRFEGDGITATVEVTGLTMDCPATASETLSRDATPEAVHLGVIYSLETDKFENKLKEFSDELRWNPSNQGYIFIGSKPDSKEFDLVAREKKLIDNLAKLMGSSYDRSRITLVRWGGKADLIELWRIPPGASNPTCRDCDTRLQCPTISVTGPAGISMPGETIYFSANIDPEPQSYKRTRWTVSDGNIVFGQDTWTLAVRMPKSPPVTATIFVEGLPKECPNSASDRYDFAIDPGPILIDEFGRLRSGAIRTKLDNLFAELSKNPNSQGYIILYGTEKEIAAREKFIVNGIAFRNFDRSRITIVRGGRHPIGTVYTKLYRVPPGSENPAP